MNTSLEDLPGEIWKDILGYEGLYQISNLGRVKSLARLRWQAYNNTEYSSSWKEKILRTRDCCGYHSLGLCKNGIMKMNKIHRLVARAFIPNPDNLPIVNHKNGIKTDNSIENLEWCTKSHDNYHAFRMGLKNCDTIRGEFSHKTKFKNMDILEIRKLYLEGISIAALARKYDVVWSAIKKIVDKETWKHI